MTHDQPTSDHTEHNLHVTLSKEALEVLDVLALSPWLSKEALIRQMIFQRAQSILDWTDAGGLSELQVRLIDVYKHLQPSPFYNTVAVLQSRLLEYGDTTAFKPALKPMSGLVLECRNKLKEAEESLKEAEQNFDAAVQAARAKP